MQILPEKIDQLELSSQEKSFARTLDKAFDEGDLAYYVLRVNPLRRAEANPMLFNLLVIKQGILLFNFNTTDDVNKARTALQTMCDYGIFQNISKDIVARLEESGYLTDKNKRLKYATNVKMVFPCIESNEIASFLTSAQRIFCQNNCLFKDDVLNIRRGGKSSVLALLSMGEDISDEDRVNNIFQRLCPEITIPRKYFLDEFQRIVVTEGVVTAADRSVQSYRLDIEQINFVNNIAKGNLLILACAGSGKSVLLISKCFKLASLNPTENFLLTCYNKNLLQYYQWAIAQAGFTNRNVKAQTIYQLCIDLLNLNNMPIPQGNNDEQHYTRIFEAANKALANGRIRQRFLGIFIDEVQIFKPEWYRFCFNLLKSKGGDDHFFCIAGDKSQDIKNNIRHGKAPWQGGGSEYPEYRGKTKPIERNYRNSKPINDAIDKYVTAAKSLGTEFGVDLTSDPELFLRGKAYRAGNQPSVIELVRFSNDGEAQAITDAIKDLIQKNGYSEVDIAVILYNSKGYGIGGWEDKRFELIAPLQRKFNSAGWEPPAILMSGGNKASFGSRTGITITTIEGSLGLDFRAVVLAGLRPLGIWEKVRSRADFQATTITEEAKRDAYKQNVNLLYTGCTRARDDLVIVLSARRGESVYLDLIRETMGGK